MYTVYEQGRGRGIGEGYEQFVERFDEICREHLDAGRAKYFAFIFYDFTDEELRQILRDEGVFATLDRLSGDKLTIFYLHADGSEKVVREFNANFLDRLYVGRTTLPCVVFFKVNGRFIGDVVVAQLSSADLIHGFHELYLVIETSLEGLNHGFKNSRYVRWLTGGGKTIGIETFKAALEAIVKGLTDAFMKAHGG